jgi:hypothetical protein
VLENGFMRFEVTGREKSISKKTILRRLRGCGQALFDTWMRTFMRPLQKVAKEPERHSREGGNLFFQQVKRDESSFSRR